MAVVQKPHYITVGATYLDAKFLNMDLATYLARIWNILQGFQATPAILQGIFT